MPLNVNVFLFFCCLSALQSVMSMVIIPLPHYNNLWRKKLKSEKKCVGSNFFSAGAAFQGWHNSGEDFALPKQTPWRRP